jgi:hypothetical protein
MYKIGRKSRVRQNPPYFSGGDHRDFRTMLLKKLVSGRLIKQIQIPAARGDNIPTSLSLGLTDKRRANHPAMSRDENFRHKARCQAAFKRMAS